MKERTPKQVFSIIGFALVAGTLAEILGSLLVLLRLLANMQSLASSFGPSAIVLLMYVPNFCFLLVFWLVARLVPKNTWSKENLSFRSLLGIFLMMYFVASLLNGAGLLFTRNTPGGGEEQLDLIGSVVNTGTLMGILVPVVIGPIVEELIFRKIMLDRIRCYGETTAIIFSAICFGLFHGNLVQFLYAFAVGVFLGYVYCKTGKVLLTMLMHMLLNGFSSGIMLIIPMVSGGEEGGKGLAVVGMLLFAVAVLVMMISGLVLLIRHLKKKDIRLDNSMPTCIPKEDVVKTVYLNPGVILFFLLSIYTILSSMFNIRIPFLERLYTGTGE